MNTKQKAVQHVVHRFFLALVTTLLLGCSAYEPEVLGVTSQEIRHLRGSGERSEELILDLEVRDRDGFSELHRVYIVNESRELYWEVEADSWHALPQEGLIRLRRLAAPRGEALPRGGYRVELFDLGGRSGEMSFTLPLLPEAALLEAREEQLIMVAEYIDSLWEGVPLAEEPPVAELFRGVALLLIPPGGFEARQLFALQEIAPFSPEERKARLAAALEEEGRVYLASRVGEAGPVYLMRAPEVGILPSEPEE